MSRRKDQKKPTPGGGKVASKVSPSRPPLTPARRRLFTILAVALPFLVLAAAEGGLRLWGWGGYPAFLRTVGPLPSGEEVCLVEPAASKPYFFANPDRPGYAEQTNFLMPKPPGTVRIFLFGESAAKGYPQPRNLSMAAFLQAMLSEIWPECRVEIIDMGTTAVASFPITYMVQDALRFDPDLFIFYTGNNEFFGAYGVASINAAGRLPPWALRGLRALRGLAVVQALDTWLNSGRGGDRTLMEQMIGRTFLPADSPLRAAAARNLQANLEEMLAAARSAGIPTLVCTTASNESGLAPLGEDDLRGLGEDQVRQVQSLLAAAKDALATEPAKALAKTGEILTTAPGSATAWFLRGRALAATGDLPAAREAFLKARDLDTMPWRPISATEEAIRRAAETGGAVLCDVAGEFRRQSPQGATGWALADDHVHLSVQGQAAAARTMVGAMEKLPGGLAVDPTRVAALPEWPDLAKRLGTNFYDDYRVNHNLRVLFGVPFMRRSNPEAFARFDAACRAAEEAMPPKVRTEARRWQTMNPHAGGLRPLTAMVARVLLAGGQTAEALPLYELARRQVPDYTSWYLEYVYFTLACRERLQGRLTEKDRAEAAGAIAQGRFLLAHGDSKTGLTERYIGRLHQLTGDWEGAIPFLLAARPRMNAEDLVACDQALVLSYVRTGRLAEAAALVEDGLRNSGRFAPLYRQLQKQVLPAR